MDRMNTLPLPQRIARILTELRVFKELEQKATKGPWVAETRDRTGNDYGYPIRVTTETGESIALHSGRATFLKDGDSSFIARARNLTPALVDGYIMAIEEHQLIMEIAEQRIINGEAAKEDFGYKYRAESALTGLCDLWDAHTKGE